MLRLNLKSREELLINVEQWTEIPMLVLVVIMIITLILPLVVPLDEATHHLLELIDWFIWGAFALELLVKTYLAPKKIVYLRKNWIDVVVVATVASGLSSFSNSQRCTGYSFTSFRPNSGPLWQVYS